MTWTVRVDSDLCVGSGMCVGVAPDHFVIVDGSSQPTAPQLSASDAAMDAASCCPMEAIAITEVATGQTVYGRADE